MAGNQTIFQQELMKTFAPLNLVLTSLLVLVFISLLISYLGIGVGQEAVEPTAIGQAVAVEIEREREREREREVVAKVIQPTASVQQIIIQPAPPAPARAAKKTFLFPNQLVFDIKNIEFSLNRDPSNSVDPSLSLLSANSDTNANGEGKLFKGQKEANDLDEITLNNNNENENETDARSEASHETLQEESFPNPEITLPQLDVGITKDNVLDHLPNQISYPLKFVESAFEKTTNVTAKVIRAPIQPALDVLNHIQPVFDLFIKRKWLIKSILPPSTTPSVQH